MFTRNSATKQTPVIERAQAIAEFAIALPVLLLMLVGIFEVGRMVFIYAAVNNASREAVRYASAVGYDDTSSTYVKYNDCAGIKDMAYRSAFFTDLTITISHDTGPGSASTPYCSGASDNITVSSGDRVTVEVSASYSPMLTLIPLRPRTFTSTTSRTILGIFELASAPGGSGHGVGGGGATATVTRTPTATGSPTPTGTETVTPTVTNTLDATAAAFTPLPSDTPTITFTPTITDTPTPTYTPTVTSTPVEGCGSITTSAISMATTNPSISMTITNPHTDVTVSSVQLVWNAATGGPAGKTLTWQSVTLGGVSWTVSDSSGNYTSYQTATIPGYNQTSKITIFFNKNYQNPIPNGTTITIYLSTPGCNPITRTQ